MSAKALMVRPVSATEANDLVRRIHYSGKVVPNSQVHMGVFWSGRLEGAMQFGPSIDKRRTAGLVTGSGMNEYIELNRMAFSDRLPRNSESRALGVALRLLRKHAPVLKWVVTFADGTQCGDGTIYRATGFLLTAIKPNKQIMRVGNAIVAKKSMDNLIDPTTGKYMSRVLTEAGAATLLPGFQLRYVKFLDEAWRPRLAVPVIPYAAIAAAGASMYKGERKAAGGRPSPLGRGGSIPTRSLQSPEVVDG